jgi:methionine-rich copper-binding protein CopC
MLKRIILITTLILNSLAFSGSAWAHAELESSSPIKESIISELPAEISLTFGEELLTLGEESVNTLELLSPLDEVLPLGPLKVQGKVLSAPVLSKTEVLESGTYTVKFRVVSADGHPVKGEISFELQKAESVPATENVPEEVPDNKESASGFGIIPLFLTIILVFSALLLIRRKR